jgi:hypothetical protein
MRPHHQRKTFRYPPNGNPCLRALQTKGVFHEVSKKLTHGAPPVVGSPDNPGTTKIAPSGAHVKA